MKTLVKLLIIFMIGYYNLFVPLLLFAQNDLKINAYVDKQVINEDESLTLTVTITTSSGGNIPQPNEPDFKDFQIDARSSSSRISIINGIQRMEISYHYSLRPLSKGRLTIGKFFIEYYDLNNTLKRIETNPITIEVNAEKKDDQKENENTEVVNEIKKELQQEKSLISNYIFITTIVILLIFSIIWFLIWQSAKRENQKKLVTNISPDKLQIVQNDKQISNLNINQSNNVQNGFSISNNKSFLNELMNQILNCKQNSNYQQMFLLISKYLKYLTMYISKTNESYLDLTNTELILKIKELPFINNYVNDIEYILSLCDMINYAKYNPSDSEVETSLKKLVLISQVIERGEKLSNE